MSSGQPENCEKVRYISGTPPRIFVVGDIHGCAEELKILLDSLRYSERLTQDDLLIFIGDYIDRGPDSQGVVEQLLEFKRDFPATSFLKGNHEDMLLGYLGLGGNQGAAYMFNGGVQFLSSYGLSSVNSPEQNAREIPGAHLEFFTNLEACIVSDRFIFVHAGLLPTRHVDEQESTDLFWIRDEFIAATHEFEKTIVFGHTPYQSVVFDLPYKIGIDTGLVYGNMLTCIELVQGILIQVKRGGNETIVTEVEGGLERHLFPLKGSDPA